MDSYVVPDLTLPFSAGIHPQAHRAQELTEQWCQRFDLLHSPAKFRALGYGRLMATLCPDAPMRGLGLITDWNGLFFIVDDQQNRAVATDRAGLYGALVETMRNVVHDVPCRTPVRGRRLVDALRDLLGRTLTDRPAYWVSRFRRNLDRWLRGHLAENHYKTSGTVPDVTEYISVRRDASTVLPTLDLVEMIEGATVSDQLYRTPQWQTLVLGTADIMCWINDIHSLPMERDDPINLVNVLAHHQDMTIQQAIDALAARITARVDEYRRAELALSPTLEALRPPAQSRAAILRCVRDQQSWAAGMENWGRTDTIRFATSEIVEDRATPEYVEDLLT